jgi:hypothetical protein
VIADVPSRVGRSVGAGARCRALPGERRGRGDTCRSAPRAGTNVSGRTFRCPQAHDFSTSAHAHPVGRAERSRAAHERPVTLTIGGERHDGSATVALEWTPSPRVVVDATFPPEAANVPQLVIADAPTVAFAHDGRSLELQVFRSSLPFPVRLRATPGSEVRHPAGPRPLARVDFQVVNFVPFGRRPLPPALPARGGSGVVLEAAGWRITVDPHAGTYRLADRLESDGGYGLTHAGTLERADGTLFDADDAGRGALGVAPLPIVRARVLVRSGAAGRGGRRWGVGLGTLGPAEAQPVGARHRLVRCGLRAAARGGIRGVHAPVGHFGVAAPATVGDLLVRPQQHDGRRPGRIHRPEPGGPRASRLGAARQGPEGPQRQQVQGPLRH